ncbi:MAG: SIS domain-containing protein [Oscillospiraceae bacterium]|nr:SIS domain-containing protein [Oscillospiraceae bacterium]
MSIFYSEIKRQPAALRKCLAAYAENNFYLIRKAAEMIAAAPAVVMTGMGTSYHTGLCALKGIAKARRVFAVQAYQLLQDECAGICDDDLLLLISQSGESGEIKELCRRRKGKNTIIGITNHMESGLANAANLVLPLYSPVEKTITNSTFTATMAVLQMLSAWVNGISPTVVAEELEKASFEAERFLASEEKVFALADRVDAQNHIHFLGRSSLEMSLAKQASLIFQEGARINAHSFSVGSFRHGPIELCGKNHAAFMYISDEESCRAMKKLSDCMRMNGSQVIPISNRAITGEAIAVQAESPEGFAVVAAILTEMLLVRFAQNNGKEAGIFTIAEKVCREI